MRHDEWHNSLFLIPLYSSFVICYFIQVYWENASNYWYTPGIILVITTILLVITTTPGNYRNYQA